MPRFLLIFLLLFTIKSGAQTFTANGGLIPDNNNRTCYPVQVTGIGNISNSTIGVASVCIDITHTWVGDLEIYLTAPDGTSVPLSYQNGGSGDNYTSTCFVGTSTNPLEDALAPFSGNFLPDGWLGSVNNGQVADGTWNLCIKDVSTGETGMLNSWSINFSTTLPSGPPVCATGNYPPGNTCATATPICSLYGYCSSTSTSYTADTWPELDNDFCGTVQNNAFLKFVATAYEMNFNVWVTSSTNHDGIQLYFYDGGCGSGAVTSYGCYSPIRPGASPTIVSATGLTVGQVYYVMVDGFAGDECDYVIEPLPSAGGLAVTTSSSTVCPRGSVQLTATGGSGSYTWTGAGLNATTGTTVIAAPSASATYTVSSTDPGGLCPTTKSVQVQMLPATDLPSAANPQPYCQHEVAPALQATGSGLLWYTTSTGGTGQTNMFPSTGNPGTFTYYVSQTLGCESERVPVIVTVKNGPDLGPDMRDTICPGTFADLSHKFDTRSMPYQWMFDSRLIAEPISVNTPGDYYLSVTNQLACSDTAIVSLVVQPVLHPSAGQDTIAVSGMPITLHSTPAATYSWTPANLLDNAHLQSPTAILHADQQFIVNVTDVAGCKASDTILVKMIQGTTYYIPNAFTPNADGLNDIFRALPVGIKRTEYFRILNRYGRVIFETTEPFYKGWDGTYLGALQSAGAYVWCIKGTDINGRIIQMKGTVVLIQ